jgi:8-amino-7-oxononanoate synthase
VTDGLDRVRATLRSREAAGLWRSLRPREAEGDVLDLAGNDYLGLARDLRVGEAAAQAARTWGAGSTGSRLVTGTTSLHAELERELADFASAPAALVFSSGYLANLGVLSALGGPDVTVVSDSANHASLIDGCRLARSPVVVVPHGDVDKFEAALAAVDTPHSLVVTDAVFSVSGAMAPITELAEVARRHGSVLVIDEAHSLGVVGAGGVGAVAAAGLDREPFVVRTVTLSKALGGQGGAVLAAGEVVDLLVNTARAFIFDTALAPASVAAARAALGILRDEPERPVAVRARAAQLAGIVRDLGADTADPAAAVVPVHVGDPARTVEAAARCLELGVRVGCFRPPSVPPGRSCLRLTAHAGLTDTDVERAASVLRSVLAG